MTLRTIRTPLLEIAYEETGPSGGKPVVLMHGFPDDIHAYDDVAPPLAAARYRVIVPYLRGYGPTRFLDPATPRSGEQAALGHDLLDLIDALDLKSPILAGYDWGGRACCVAAALWPERVGGLVSITGYNIQNIATANQPPPSIAIGTSSISTPNAASPGSRKTVGRYADCSGNCGRRTTASPTPIMPRPRHPSTTRTSSRW
jgi:pimeloyl-ACP methyl ester carboxylesterase